MSDLYTGIACRLAAVRARIEAACERAGRDPACVTLIGVTKSQPLSAIHEAWRAGLRDFGENYIQEALAKLTAFSAEASPSFHFIGHLQTNKVRLAARHFAILHSIDSERLLDALSAASTGSPQPVMLQVNLAAEATKSGLPLAGLPGLVRHALSLPGIDLRGLMTIPPPASDPAANRPWFRQLRTLGEEHGLNGLSMGMTDDFETAIEAGATHIRVGRAIFGERTK